MNNKKINTEELVFKWIFVKIYEFFTRFFLHILVLVLFFICYRLTFYIFSNEYVINNFFEGKGYSHSCLNLTDSKDLLLQLDNFYNKSNIQSSAVNIVSPVFFNNISNNFNNISSIEIKKRVFINILLPILLKIEIEVEKERKKLLELSVKIVQVYLTDSDIAFLDMMVNKYDISMNDNNFWDYSLALEELIKRVDVIPTSLVLAIAAQETGWGGSRFLIEANALFSQYSWKDEDGVIPQKRKEGERHSIKKYSTLEASVRSFYRNINTNNYYQEFRESRTRMRGDIGTRDLSARNLARELSKYSIEGSKYISQLIQILNSNNLSKYDSNKQFSMEKSVCITILR